MNEEKLLNQISNLRVGRFFKITYVSEPPLKAASKEINLTKVTTKIVRTGCNYGNLKAVKNKQKDPETAKKNQPEWFDWTMKNKVVTHKKTGENYFVFYPMTKGTNTQTVWKREGQTITLEQAKDHVIPSYFEKRDPTPIQMIKLSNIVKIEG